MSEQHHKSFGAWLPAEILYNHAITPRQKILYCTIFNLSNQKGYCWATNGYFAKEFDVSHDSVGRDIKALIEANYVNTEMIPNASGTERRIRIEGGLRTSAERGLRTSATHKNINTNKQIPLIVKGWYQEMKEKHPKVLKNLSQSVDSITVTLEEIEKIVAATNLYNENRSMGLWMILKDRSKKPVPDSDRNPDAKACKEIVRRLRDGWTLDKMDEKIANMFDAKFHKDLMFKNLSLEFCHRQDKLEMYEFSADAA